MVYPVLINPSDLEDSDQETSPVKKNKKVKKKILERMQRGGGGEKNVLLT